jgi:hypothetical protein
LPRSDSRQIFRSPEDTPARGGAVAGGEMAPAGEPGHGDDIADDGGRDDRPGAEDLGDAGTGCLDRGGQLLPGLAPLGIQVADVGQQLGGELAARLGNSARWPDLAEEPGGLACGDPIWHPAGNQLAKQRMQPAGGLVACPGKIAVPFGPHLQHAGVVIGDHFPPGLGPQRRHRHRQGIVRVALAGVPDLQQPHPGSQLGLHIGHPLASGDQLLGQQAAQPWAPSTAQARSGQACAQATSFSA